MKLIRWLELPNADGTKRRRSAFAAAIGVTPSMVKLYCDDTAWPGRQVMEAIVRETKSEVTANDFLSIVPETPPQQQSEAAE